MFIVRKKLDEINRVKMIRTDKGVIRKLSYIHIIYRKIIIYRKNFNNCEIYFFDCIDEKYIEKSRRKT